MLIKKKINVLEKIIQLQQQTFQDKYIIQIIIHWNKIPVKTFRKPNQNYTHSLSPRSFFHSNSQYPLNNIPLLSASPPTPSKFVNRAVPS